MSEQKSTVFSQKVMAGRKEAFTKAVSGMVVEGFAMVGQTKEGVVFEEVQTGAFVVVKSVAKKEEFDFSEAESEFLEAIEAREEKARVAEEKRLKRESKKVKEVETVEE